LQDKAKAAASCCFLHQKARAVQIIVPRTKKTISRRASTTTMLRNLKISKRKVSTLFISYLNFSGDNEHQLPSLSKPEDQQKKTLCKVALLEEAFIRGNEILHQNNQSKFGKLLH
jgi:hypothetical protein